MQACSPCFLCDWEQLPSWSWKVSCVANGWKSSPHLLLLQCCRRTAGPGASGCSSVKPSLGPWTPGTPSPFLQPSSPLHRSWSPQSTAQAPPPFWTWHYPVGQSPSLWQTCRGIDHSVSTDRPRVLEDDVLWFLHSTSVGSWVGLHCSLRSCHLAIGVVGVVRGLAICIGWLAGGSLGPLEKTWALFLAIGEMATTHPRILVWLPVCSSAKQNVKNTNNYYKWVSAVLWYTRVWFTVFFLFWFGQISEDMIHDPCSFTLAYACVLFFPLESSQDSEYMTLTMSFSIVTSSGLPEDGSVDCFLTLLHTSANLS